MSSIPYPGPGGAHRVYTDDQRRVIARLARLAYLLDARFRVPGSEFRVGLDGLLGLIPGIGDTAALALSAYIIIEAQKLDVPAHVTARMIGNVALDFFVGTVPVLGDLFDFAFKANIRNLRLLGIEPRWD